MRFAFGQRLHEPEELCLGDLGRITSRFRRRGTQKLCCGSSFRLSFPGGDRSAVSEFSAEGAVLKRGEQRVELRQRRTVRHS
jgi:hypothetical protein